jgi:aryl-alcohol dehydrogenase-like predicted oxidoreductase
VYAVPLLALTVQVEPFSAVIVPISPWAWLALPGAVAAGGVVVVEAALGLLDPPEHAATPIATEAPTTPIAAVVPIRARPQPSTLRDEALAVLRRAVELGVNHIDTAQYYGPKVANELIRQALYPYPDDLVIVSKVGGRRGDTGAWLPAGDPDELRRGIEDNLHTLGLDQLTAVNLRVMDSEEADPSQPGQLRGKQFDQQLIAMIKARDEGLIAGIGLSNITREHLLFALERTEIACVQNAYNLIDRASQAVLDECTARGIAFVPFFPLGSGFARDNPSWATT